VKLVSSRDNPLVKRLRALATSAKERRKLEQTIVDGPHLVRAALDAHWPILELVVSERGLERDEILTLQGECGEVPITLLPDALFAHVSPVETPSGMLAVIGVPPEAPLTPRIDTSVLVLDGVQDPGNLGTILRTAAAAGLAHVVLTKGSVQAWSPKVLRAGMGAHFCLTIHEHADATEVLRAFPGQILATRLDAAAIPLFECDLSDPVAWLFGGEGAGLSAELAALATASVMIPMPGAIESLNVGAAAAICLFEQLRQNRATSRPDR